MKNKTKVCTGKCGRELEVNDINFGYHQKAKDNKAPRCRTCVNTYQRELNEKNKIESKVYGLDNPSDADYEWFGTGFGTY